jgi:hypothetical protein
MGTLVRDHSLGWRAWYNRGGRRNPLESDMAVGTRRCLIRSAKAFSSQTAGLHLPG